ncbi:uncharacterized protein ACJ7VT_000469 [Polymixia lowei]
MALSQIQCLDENHVNPRTHESKAEFFYCEDQRLALETLIRDGRDGFDRFLKTHDLRGFLSDPELQVLNDTAETYDPGSDLYPADGQDDDPPLSLQYWPDLSDRSVPVLDLGWPDCASYRGVTRTHVYAQPPLDGHAHIKEIVRKTIAQAHKVIAVVMDVFTDVDIFRDLLEAGFKRKVSVYILLERTMLPHFLSMCERANMHAGHLKNLRVRCEGGAVFYTRSCTRIRGRLGHRFMFVDGDRAVSGSYSYTWMSSRLDRHLITVVTGQAVDAFDSLFRDLYATSSAVDLRQVAMETAPEPEPLPQPAPAVPVSAALARKLFNPKYSLLAMGNSSPTSSSGNNSPKDSISQNLTPSESRRKRRRRANKEAIAEGPPLHPGLANLEKAFLIPYLPTWPEPDPPSDVIGFINIRDTSRPTQVHLQRSERFETSQAIRFSSPISLPVETLPEVAQPRLLTAKHDKTQPRQLNATPSNPEPKAQTTEKKPHTSGQDTHPAELKLVNTNTPEADTLKATMHVLNTVSSNTSTNQNAAHSTTPQLNTHTPVSNTASTFQPGSAMPAHLPESLPSAAGTTKPNLNTQTADMYITHTLNSNRTQTSNPLHIHASLSMHTTHMIDQLNTKPHTETQSMLAHEDLRTQSVHTKPQSPSKCDPSPSVPSPTLHNDIASSSASPICPLPVSSTSRSDSTPTLVASTPTAPPIPSGACPPLIHSTPTSSPSLLLPSSTSTTPDPPTSSILSHSLPASSLTTSRITTPHASASPSTSSPPISNPPVPKPRTVQLVIHQLDRREVSVAKKPWSVASTGPPAGHDEPAIGPLVERIVSAAQTQQDPDTVPCSGKETEARPQLQNRSRMETGLQTDIEKNSRKPREGQTQSGTTKELEGIREAATGLQHDFKSRTGMQMATGHKQPAILTTNTPKADGAHVKEIMLRQFETKSVTLTDIHLTPKPQPHTLPKQPETEHSVDVHASAQDVTASILHTRTQQGEHVMSANNTQSPIKGGSQTPEDLCLPFPDPATCTAEVLPPTPERDLRSRTPLFRTPTPDRLPLRTPTPDSRTHTPDLRSYTPDIRTPMSDVSDGYFSPREDSTLSTTSDEYYECSDSPFNEPFLDRQANRGHWTTEDPIITNTNNTATATTTTTSSHTSAYTNTSVSAAITCSATDCSTSNRDTQSLSATSANIRIPTSSIPQTRENMGDEREITKEEEGSGRRDQEYAITLPEKATEKGGSSLETKRRANNQEESSLETKITANQEESSLETKRTANQEESSLDTKRTANQEESSLETKRTANQEESSLETKRTANQEESSLETKRTANHEESSLETKRTANNHKESLLSAEKHEKALPDVPERKRALDLTPSSDPSPVLFPSSFSSDKPPALPLTSFSPTPTARNTAPPRVALLESSDASGKPQKPVISSSEGYRTEEEQEPCPKIKDSPGVLVLCVMEEAVNTSEESSAKRLKTEEPPVSGVNQEELTSKGAEPEDLCTDDFKLKEFATEEVTLTELPSRGERPKEVASSRERAGETPALGPSSVEKRDRQQSARVTEGKKVLRTPPRPPRSQHQQQSQDSRVASQSRAARPSRSPRSYTAPQTSGVNHTLNQAGTKLVQASLQILDNTSTACRPPFRQTPPKPEAGGVGVAGRRQAEDSPAHHSFPLRQPSGVQGRVRAGQSQSQPPYPKPQASFLHTHSNLQSQIQPQSQLLSFHNQAATQAQPTVRQGSGSGSGEATGQEQEQGKAPFGFSFGRLYNLKGLKDKMGKPPPQSKRKSTSSPIQGRKSTG